ncbi:MAG: hypothetical protein DMF78_21570 [Acidobacteria bacterium]|nr:MAG: hypothetical protein DMF78_21570 [Acidobacteriota bacterium]
MPVDTPWVTTALGFEGYRIAAHRGVVRGITVRSRSIVGNMGAALQTLVGGNITIYTELCERARQEAFDIMRQHAAEVGANAIIAMRYDANEVAQGVTEVLAYGTAVVVAPA